MPEFFDGTGERMTPVYSLVHLTNIDCPPPEMIRIAAKTGYDAVSLRTIPMGLKGERPYDIARDALLLKETKRAAEETGIWLHDTENARIAEGVEVTDYEPSLAAAAELGIRHILTNIWTDNKDFYTQQYGKLCELAAQYEQTVSVEFVTWAGVTNLQQVKELLMTVRKENVGVVLDCLHFYRSRVSLEEIDDCPNEWFHYAHLCDCEAPIPDDEAALIHTGRAERLYPGEGCIPIREIISRIPDAVRGIEVPHLERVGRYGYEEHARRALESARMCLEQNQSEKQK